MEHRWVKGSEQQGMVFMNMLNGKLPKAMGGRKEALDVTEKFHSKINKVGDCWLWVGVKNKQNGYGYFQLTKRYRGDGLTTTHIAAHRASWIIHTGKLIPAGVLILHSCDNRHCVNPAHLREGYHVDNTRDIVVAGKFHRKSMFTDKQIKDIRKRYANGEPPYRIAGSFGVKRQAISNIVNGVTHRHISADGSDEHAVRCPKCYHYFLHSKRPTTMPTLGKPGPKGRDKTIN